MALVPYTPDSITPHSGQVGFSMAPLATALWSADLGQGWGRLTGAPLSIHAVWLNPGREWGASPLHTTARRDASLRIPGSGAETHCGVGLGTGRVELAR